MLTREAADSLRAVRDDVVAQGYSLKIYDESNSIFNQIRIENMNQSLIVMKDEAKKQALDGGLLNAAKTHAELLIRTILNSIPELEGYTCEFVWPEEDDTV